jgi:4a-hydroxytetrahydrobiopterin dehydratase
VTLCPSRCYSYSHSHMSSSPSAPASPASPAPLFSPDQPQDLPARVDALVHWRLTASRKGLTRTFTFASFAKAWSFMSRVADESKAQKHHPEWSNLYNRVTVEWTTHRPEGLSIKDAHMAAFCDGVAAEIGLKE